MQFGLYFALCGAAMALGAAPVAFYCWVMTHSDRAATQRLGARLLGFSSGVGIAGAMIASAGGAIACADLARQMAEVAP